MAVPIKPEDDDGNNEYKLKLIDIRKDALDKKVSQMLHRIIEGEFDKAIYDIGYSDSGDPEGICKSDMILSMSTRV
jgi:GTPase